MTIKAMLEHVAAAAFAGLDEWRTRRFVERLRRLPAPALDLPCEPEGRFKHSGNAGDLIYALPAMRALARGNPLAIRLELNVADSGAKADHPVGGVRLNERMFGMLQPLLLVQPAVASCEVFTGQPLDYDLDLFRHYPFGLQRGHIARWYFLTFAVSADLGRPWLQVEADGAFSDHILIGRSARYHAPLIDYAFLRRYPKIAFVGVEAEFEAMRRMIPQLEWHRVDDFLQMARAVAGARLFIGNQSFPFSLAEGLKVRRMLEVSPLAPNVIVEGANGFDFCYQPQFESLFRRVMQ